MPADYDYHSNEIGDYIKTVSSVSKSNCKHSGYNTKLQCFEIHQLHRTWSSKYNSATATPATAVSIHDKFASECEARIGNKLSPTHFITKSIVITLRNSPQPLQLINYAICYSIEVFNSNSRLPPTLSNTNAYHQHISTCTRQEKSPSNFLMFAKRRVSFCVTVKRRWKV